MNVSDIIFYNCGRAKKKKKKAVDWMDHNPTHLPNAKLWGTDMITILRTAAEHEAKLEAFIF